MALGDPEPNPILLLPPQNLAAKTQPENDRPARLADRTFHFHLSNSPMLFPWKFESRGAYSRERVCLRSCVPHRRGAIQRKYSCPESAARQARFRKQQSTRAIRRIFYPAHLTPL